MTTPTFDEKLRLILLLACSNWDVRMELSGYDGSGKTNEVLIESVTAIKSLIADEIIGSDEDASWQKIWENGKSYKIDDPDIVSRNELRAEQRRKLNG